jgi:Sigma-70 region 2
VSTTTGQGGEHEMSERGAPSRRAGRSSPGTGRSTPGSWPPWRSPLVTSTWRDVTAEAFARALERWERVGSMASPGGWTYRVALNVLRRRLRRGALEEHLLRRAPGRQPPALTDQGLRVDGGEPSAPDPDGGRLALPGRPDRGGGRRRHWPSWSGAPLGFDAVGGAPASA